ncbi:MAG: hypothetical protein V7631_1346 [Massilia sp.]
MMPDMAADDIWFGVWYPSCNGLPGREARAGMAPRQDPCFGMPGREADATRARQATGCAAQDALRSRASSLSAGSGGAGTWVTRMRSMRLPSMSMTSKRYSSQATTSDARGM